MKRKLPSKAVGPQKKAKYNGFSLWDKIQDCGGSGLYNIILSMLSDEDIRCRMVPSAMIPRYHKHELKSMHTITKFPDGIRLRKAKSAGTNKLPSTVKELTLTKFMPSTSLPAGINIIRLENCYARNNIYLATLVEIHGIDPSRIKSYMPSLKILKADYHWENIDCTLFPVLDDLKVCYVRSVFPASVTRLEFHSTTIAINDYALKYAKTQADSVPKLPQTIEELKLGYVGKPEHFTFNFPNLKKLVMDVYSHDSEIWDFSKLGDQLTDLTIKGGVIISKLPPNIKRLHISSHMTYESTSPTFIEYLEVDIKYPESGSWTTSKIAGLINEGLKHIKINAWEHKFIEAKIFPQSLKVIEMGPLYFNPHDPNAVRKAGMYNGIKLMYESKRAKEVDIKNKHLDIARAQKRIVKHQKIIEGDLQLLDDFDETIRSSHKSIKILGR